MAGYPLDEFDDVPEGFSGSRANHRRQGVHREEPRATKRLGLWLIIATATMALIIGAAAFFLLPRLGIGGSNGGVLEAEGSASQTSSASSTSSSPSSSPFSARPSPSATVDKQTPIPVYNATTISGLASRASAHLRSGGFVPGNTDNWNGAAVDSSVVYYVTENQLSTAQAVGEALGIATIQADSSVTGVTVVLGPEYSAD